jgi:hypothetical protein
VSLSVLSPEIEGRHEVEVGNWAKHKKSFYSEWYTIRESARSLETFWFSKIVLIWKLVAGYNRLLQVQMKYFQNWIWSVSSLQVRLQKKRHFNFNRLYGDTQKGAIFDCLKIRVLKFKQNNKTILNNLVNTFSPSTGEF